MGCGLPLTGAHCGQHTATVTACDCEPAPPELQEKVVCILHCPHAGF